MPDISKYIEVKSGCIIADVANNGEELHEIQ
jgi:hypothetical protein